MLTRKDLREEVAQVFGWHESAATGGDTTSVVDTSLIPYANDYWNGAWVLIISADGAAPNGESRVVTDYNADAYTLTVLPAFSEVVQSGDTYQLYQNVTPTEINRALTRACRGMAVATSLTPSTTQLDYQLGGAYGLQRPQQITGVWLRAQNLATLMPVRIEGWQLEDAEGLLTLRLPYLLTASDHLWITYVLDETSITEDTDGVNLPTDLMKARAVVYLLELVMSRQGTPGQERWGSLLRYWSQKLTTETYRYQRTSGRVTNYNWPNERYRTAEDALNIASTYG